VVLDELRSGLVFAASPGDRLVDCAARMLDRRVGCLPVLAQGRAVRIVTRRDLVDAAATALEDESLFEGAPSELHVP
jgi:CBS domain-containing protein